MKGIHQAVVSGHDIVLPAEVRAAMKVATGDPLSVVVDDDGVCHVAKAVPAKNAQGGSLADALAQLSPEMRALAGSLKVSRKLSVEEENAAFDEAFREAWKSQ